MKLKYRPEVDGLRAISVLLVIFYHAQLSFNGIQIVHGGFIGVDIFFVISGYLITSLLLKELLKDNNFSILEFYQRRIRRIIPLLIIVTIVSLPLGWFSLTGSNFKSFLYSLIYSLGFGSNFFFFFDNLEYRSVDSLLKPFLHSWSLSVEEQFYIFFPIFLLTVYKYLRKYLLFFFILLFISSFLFANFESGKNQILSFYFIHTRLWEIIAGSILAFFEIKFQKKKRNKHPYNYIFSWIGIILILLSGFLFTHNTFHPSYITLIPILGTCLIIWHISENEAIYKILTSKILVSLGLISYSLYLWHYPLFAFARNTNSFQYGSDKIKWIFITFILSIISYFLIEKVARNVKFKFKYLVSIILFLLIPTLIFIFSGIKTNGFYDLRFKNIYANNILDKKILNQERGKFRNISKKNFLDNSKTNILILGDSHSLDTFNMFYLNREIFSQYEFRRLKYFIHDDPEFLKINKIINSKLFKQSNILLISDFSNNLEHMVHFDKLIKYLKKFNKKIILMSMGNTYSETLSSINLPTYQNNLTLFDKYLIDKYFSKQEIFIDNDLTEEDLKNINLIYFKEKNEMDLINSSLKKIAKNNEIIFFSKQKYMCDNKLKICFGITQDGEKIFSDGDHYTLKGAKFFGEKIFEKKLFE